MTRNWWSTLQRSCEKYTIIRLESLTWTSIGILVTLTIIISINLTKTCIIVGFLSIHLELILFSVVFLLCPHMLLFFSSSLLHFLPENLLFLVSPLLHLSSISFLVFSCLSLVILLNLLSFSLLLSDDFFLSLLFLYLELYSFLLLFFELQFEELSLPFLLIFPCDSLLFQFLLSFFCLFLFSLSLSLSCLFFFLDL